MAESQGRSGLRYGGYILGAIALIIIFYAAIALLAWQSGQSDRELEAQIQLTQAVERQLELVQQDISAENRDLAERRLEWLLQNASNSAEVISIQATLSYEEPTALPTPVLSTSDNGVTLEPTPTDEALFPTPNITPAPTVTRRPINASTELREIESLIEREAWESAINAIIALQLDSPDYERYYTDTLLQQAYIEAGFDLTNSSQVSLGISYFELAERLGPLPEDAVSQLYFSRQYLNGIAAFGINWPRSIDALNEICEFAPLYQDSCSLLFEARTQYADQLIAAGNSCGAADQLQWALSIGNSSSASQKLSTERWRCDNATPTPWPSGG